MATYSVIREFVDFISVGVIGQRGRKIVRQRATVLLNRLGLRPSLALNGLDAKLAPYLREVPRTFVEAGANDGLTQSNTYYLERAGWTGLLVEPMPPLADLCMKFRTAPVAVAALGSFADAGTEIAIPFEDLVSSYERGSIPPARFRNWGGLFGEKLYGRIYSCRIEPLSHLLELHRVPEVGLLSLDVEGYECSALSGIDFTTHRIHRILVETDQPDKVAAILPDHHMTARLSHHDYLFALN